MVKASEMEGVTVPEPMIDALNRTLTNLELLETQLPQFLSLSDPQLLSQMPPLQRANTLFFLSKITSTLFSLKLRCRGVNPDDHPIKSEFKRLSLYQKKLERLGNLSEAPLQPSITLNSQAATRIIEHSLPDLSSAQKQVMRSISRGEGPKMNYQEQAGQKRKYPSSDEQSVQTAAEEFLEKATEDGELPVDNNGSINEPIVIDISDDDDDDDDNDDVVVDDDDDYDDEIEALFGP